MEVSEATKECQISFRVSQNNLFIFFAARMLLDGGLRGEGGGLAGIFNVNEDTDRDLRLFYCFVLSVKYEKELKGRRLKRGLWRM